MPNKRTAGIILAALLLSAFPGLAQRPAQDPALPVETSSALQKITGDKILAHVWTLASDKFEGRAPATLGESLTVDYISQQFREAGLQPGNPNGTFVQQVPLTGYKTTAKIGLTIKGRPVPLKFMDDFVHDAPRLVARADEQITGVVFAGYGISAPQFGWDDYKNADVRNKLVLVLSGEPSRQDSNDPKKSDSSFFKGDLSTYYATREFKYEEAQRRGAAGILVITDPEKAQTYSLFQTFAKMEGMSLRMTSPGRSLAITGLVTKKAADRLLSAAGLDLAEKEKYAERSDFRPIPMKIAGKISIRSRIRHLKSRNVLAKLEGSDPGLKNEYVIYSAHWDHLGKDTSLIGDQIFNGANDNAAGVAQLIEVARAFAALGKRPRRSILFIATTAEEKGYLGAKYYALKPLYPISQTVAAINLDAGNLYGLTSDLGSTGYGNSTLDNALADAAAIQGRAFLKGSIDNGGMYFASDQIEFAKAGVPAVFPWSGFEYVGKSADYGQKVWNEYGAKRYHQVSDQVMPDWDMSGAVEDARWMMIAGLLVANAVERPVWHAGSEFLWIGKKSKRIIGVKKK